MKRFLIPYRYDVVTESVSSDNFIVIEEQIANLRIGLSFLDQISIFNIKQSNASISRTPTSCYYIIFRLRPIQCLHCREMIFFHERNFWLWGKNVQFIVISSTGEILAISVPLQSTDFLFMVVISLLYQFRS